MSLPSAVADSFSRYFVPRMRANAPSASDTKLVRRVNEAVRDLSGESASSLKSLVSDLRSRVHDCGLDVKSDDVLVHGLALVAESFRRELEIECYEVQVLAACVLVRGGIAEMATGEGKTLVQALAAFVLALPGKGVHVMTSNAYLAERDYQQLAPVLERLGMTVGLLRPAAESQEKAQAYRADITFGAGVEFGFDYLRDQIASREVIPLLVGDSFRQRLRSEPTRETISIQRGQAVAIVDEADSVMIDEASTPLLMSSTSDGSAETEPAYRHAAKVATMLLDNVDYVLDRPKRLASLTRNGLERILAKKMMPKGIRLERPWAVYVERALAAQHFLVHDVDYVLEGDRVVVVDQATGRVFPDRSFSQGMHQAVEAKEGLPVTEPRRTSARLSRQQLFRLYGTLCGMTGTAQDAAREFREIYDQKVVAIPTRRPCRRTSLPTRFFADKKHKQAAVVADVQSRNAARQPVLVGTPNIDESVQLARLFKDVGLSFQLLNGRQDMGEAQIIALAGAPAAITIATNIAGRGTDIRLGPGVEELGGLHVIITEPHACSRVDRQLLGRAARQGDPGSCQMFVSAEDELICVFASRLARTMRRLADANGEIHEQLAGEIARVQKRVERTKFEKRRQLLRHDAWRDDVLAKLTGNETA